MLVLSRKLGQSIVIGDNIKVEILSVKGNTVRLGISAPEAVKVLRSELLPYDVTTDEISDRTPGSNETVYFT